MEKQRFPTLPGVYIFKNKQNVVIYIGKAKNIKKRLETYFRAHYKDWKHAALMQEQATVDFVITKSEDESLLLEAQLIQQYQPKFNILFKEGKPFVYIVFSNEKLPIAAIVRSNSKRGTYFGPFLKKTDARKVLKFLVDTFKLSVCDKKMSNGCLRYHLNLCAGNCRDDFDAQDYLFRVDLAKNVLSKNQKKFLENLKSQIATYIGTKQFERARQLHRYLENFESIFSTIKADYSPEKFVPQVTTVTTAQTPQKNEQLAFSLQDLLQTQKPLHTIDCFDISHFQSKAIVGSCIRFSDGVPTPAKFRRFLIKTITKQDDYAALTEILKRRYRNIDELPDLILVDGGKGQLSVATTLFPTAICASLAKKEETLYANTILDGIRLDLHSDIGRMLIALRDYTHHFAITYHRLIRSKKQ